ncbi:MAG: hypothetical protein WBB25_12245 [Sulfitobacter sp.]
MNDNDTTETEALRAVAYALFSLGTEGDGESSERHDQWTADRKEHLTNARRMVRRLEAKGYTISKA